MTRVEEDKVLVLAVIAARGSSNLRASVPLPSCPGQDCLEKTLVLSLRNASLIPQAFSCLHLIFFLPF